MRKKVAIAGIFHETHTFVETQTERSDFHWLEGDEMLSARGSGSPLDGVLELAEESNWDIAPIIDIKANPSGMVVDEVVHAFWDVLISDLKRLTSSGIDGIYLVLHGAMVSESYDDVEGETLKRIRAGTGATLPICGVFDLHANFTASMAEHSNGLIAYCKNPHTDAKAAARKGAAWLDQLMRDNIVSKTYFQQTAIVWPPEGTATSNEPMHGLESRARAYEGQHEAVSAVNVIAGFSFADTADTGVSFSVISSGDQNVAQNVADAILKDLSEYARSNQQLGTPGKLLPLDSILDKVELNSGDNGPILLIEPSDNIGGGAPGDGTEIFRFFMARKLTNTAVIINDPESVEALATVSVGDKCTLAIGGKKNPCDQGPVNTEVTLLKKTDGHFELEDIHSHLASMLGKEITMGPSALLDCDGIFILLTSNATPPFDLGQWKHMEIDPAKLRAIGIKAAIGHKQAYDPIAKASYTVDTPGVCSSDLKSLPFKKIRRPVYPLDEV